MEMCRPEPLELELLSYSLHSSKSFLKITRPKETSFPEIIGGQGNWCKLAVEELPKCVNLKCKIYMVCNV